MLIDPVIYCITNIINDKQYVGQAVVKNKRWKDHKSSLNVGKHNNAYLQSAYNKYGKENFIYTILEVIDGGVNLIARLTEREQYWMNKLNTVAPNGYNLNPTAGSAIGFKHSEETKQRWSEQRKGQKRSEEAKANISAGHKKRKPVSDETREKLRLAQTGKVKSEETKRKMSEAKLGNTINNGRKQSKEVIEHRASFHRGKITSEETKAKMSDAQKGSKLTTEHKLKLSIAARNRVARSKTLLT